MDCPGVGHVVVPIDIHRLSMYEQLKRIYPGMPQFVLALASLALLVDLDRSGGLAEHLTVTCRSAGKGLGRKVELLVSRKIQ